MKEYGETMSDLSLNFNQIPHLKQMHRLMMSAKMQQAILFLQLPALELAELVKMEIEQNPVISQFESETEGEGNILEEDEEGETETSNEQELSFNDQDFSALRQQDDEGGNGWIEEKHWQPSKAPEDTQHGNFIEQSIPFQRSLFEHLMQQARETLDASQLPIAEKIIGNLNQEGYLHTPLEEIAQQLQVSNSKLQEVLTSIQTFEPYGIAATSLQEALLIQLHMVGKQDSLAAQIVAKHYDDLLHNRMPAIQKSLQCTSKEISKALLVLSHLDLHPGLSYSKAIIQPIIPDATLRQNGEEWIVTINDEYMPPLYVNEKYARMIHDEAIEAGTKEFIKRHISSAHWLLRNIHQRNETLTKIVLGLSKWQKTFFQDSDGKLAPLTMKMLADDLDVHESTIARTVSNKYIDTPRGLLALRTFFNNAYETRDGNEISSETVRDLLKEMIAKEDKKRPLSDEKLSKHLQEKGIMCARRTVAKYRTELCLGNAQQRKKF